MQTRNETVGIMKGGFAMEWCQLDAKKCLEFSRKMAVLRKLVRLGLISENEYILAKNKIMSSYHILESEYFKSNAENKLLSNHNQYWGDGGVCVCMKMCMQALLLWDEQYLFCMFVHIFIF